jgi:hypothetical protein
MIEGRVRVWTELQLFGEDVYDVMHIRHAHERCNI